MRAGWVFPFPQYLPTPYVSCWPTPALSGRVTPSHPILQCTRRQTQVVQSDDKTVPGAALDQRQRRTQYIRSSTEHSCLTLTQTQDSNNDNTTERNRYNTDRLANSNGFSHSLTRTPVLSSYTCFCGLLAFFRPRSALSRPAPNQTKPELDPSIHNNPILGSIKARQSRGIVLS